RSRACSGKSVLVPCSFRRLAVVVGPSYHAFPAMGMLEGVTIEQLRTLRAVAEEGSFTAAARKLGRVQAAVSQAIDRLEAQLGLRVFDRTGRQPGAAPP